MLRRFVLLLIRGYQTTVSPHKRFHCARVAVHGGSSCSVAVAQIVAEVGPWRGRKRIRRRFADCRSAAQTLRRQPGFAERGALDCDCGPASCDHITSFDSCSGGGDAAASSTGPSECALRDLFVALTDIGIRNLILMLIVAALAVAGWLAYDYGATVTYVEVVSLDDAHQASPGLLDRVLARGEQKLHLVLVTSDGETLKTAAITGDLTSGMRFAPPEDIRIGQIDTLTLQRRQLLSAQDLVHIVRSDRVNEKDGYRFVIRTNWAIFESP